MHPYGVRDVEKLLRLPRSTIRALIAAGFVSPVRGPRSAWRFSFQDLIVLRTAQALADAKVPQRRITRSVRELRRHLPDAMPLSGLSICAVADRVVVKEGGGRWQADSGQYLLEFEGDPADGSLSVIERNTAAEARTSAPEWFDKAVALEKEDAEAALAAYEQAIASDPALLDAHINLGRLLHEAGRFAKAEQVYRDAVRTCGSDGGLRSSAARRSGPGRLPLQPGAALRKAREAEGRDPAHGAVSRTDRQQIELRSRAGEPTSA